MGRSAFSNDAFIFKKIFFDKLYLAGLFVFYGSTFFLQNYFFLKIAPLVAATVGYSYFLIAVKWKLTVSTLPVFVFVFFLSVVAALYVFFEQGFIGFFSLEALYFFSLVLMLFAAFRLVFNKESEFLNKAFFIFLLFQLILMLGQLMKMLTGVGLHVPAELVQSASEANKLLLSGTFVNSNDLAAVCVMIALFFMLNYRVSNRFYRLAISMIFLILLLTVSRSSLLVFICMYLYFEAKRSFLKLQVLVVLFVSMFSVFYIVGVSFPENYDVVDRIVHRINTIPKILSGGLQADNSLSLRVNSYLNFFHNLPELGLGSGKYQDYDEFVSELGPRYRLYATNPHSFVVEVSYWLGWAGLALLSLFLLSCLSMRSFFLSLMIVAIFIVMSSVSSSIIGNFVFMFVFFCCIFLVFYKDGKGEVKSVS